MGNKPFISIVIIGFNTKKELEKLLFSIKQLQNESIEIIYIDDGSTDSSYAMYSSFDLQYIKRGKKLNRNKGRTCATQEGLSLARGEWLYFVRSNEIILKTTLDNYLNIINKNNAKAYMGVVQYNSNDKIFEQYLNSHHRGVKRFAPGSNIHYKYLLFNNSIIHHSVFKLIKLNQSLGGYGGEELDFSYRLNQVYPNQIKACPDAVVIRNNYPSLEDHCVRLVAFGSNNFKCLPFKLKLDIVRTRLLLYFKIMILADSLYRLCFLLYKNNNKYNHYIIRIIMLSSILRGYYKGS